GDALVVEQPAFQVGGGDVALINHASGAIVAKISGPAFSSLTLWDVALASDNTFYVLGTQSDAFTGVIVHMDFSGNTLGSITLPTDPRTSTSNFFSPEGFGLDPRDGSFWVPLVNAGSLIHVAPSGTVLSSVPVGTNPNDAAVGPDGKIYITFPGS